MKITFLTTEEPIYLPAFFDRVLPALQAAGHDIRVYACPPLYKNQTTIQAALRYWRTFGTLSTLRLISRVLGTKIRNQSVASSARRAQVPCHSVDDVNAESFLEKLRQEQVEVLVSVSCPQIFKTPLIRLAPQGILNIHGAILPQYRGVMPSFWMLANGEKQAGVSIYFVNEQIDAGALCGQRIFDIDPHETLDAFVRRSKAIAAELLIDTIHRMSKGEIDSTPLDLSKGSYFSWPTTEAVARFRAAGRRVG